MTKRFEGKAALVTGASSGIGRAAARALAEGGAYVTAVARRRGPLETLVAELDAEHARLCEADLTRPADRERVVAEAIEAWGGLDILINAAGAISFGTLVDTSVGEWQRMFEVNVTAVFHLTQLSLPHLESRKGVVVVVSSVNGMRSFPGVLAYCSSKAAVDHMVRCSALELAPKGVRINAVNPGVVVTELHRSAGMSQPAYERFLEHSKTTHPLGRAGRPEEVAELICYLASEEAGFITGATVPIDGGRNLTCLR